MLRLHPAARGLSDDEMQMIADVIRISKFGPGEIVVEKGTVPISVRLVIGGRFRMTVAPDRLDTVANFGPGEQLGFLSVLSEEASTVSIIADEPSMTLDIAPVHLFRLMDQLPLLAKNLLRMVTSGFNDQFVRRRLGHRPRCVTFLHTCAQARDVVSRVTNRLLELGERVGTVTDDATRSHDANTFVTPSRVDQQSESAIRERLGHWSDYDRIIFDVDLQCNDLQWDQLAQLYSFSQQIYLVVTPDTALGQTAELVQVIDRADAWKHKLEVVWALPPGVQVAPAVDALFDRIKHDFKVTPRPETGIDPSVERIVHALRGVRIGIALGGGAARGMSHYGILDVMEKANIVVDDFAGTSVGAMLGVTYCSGYSVDFGIESYTRDLKLPWIYRRFRSGGKWYLLRKFRTRAWEGMLRNYLDDWRLEQLPIPIQTVGVDLTRGEEVIRWRGDAVDAILESINLPYLAAPICRDGQTLVDGGMLNVIPADALVRAGCNYVIAVNVSTKVRHTFAGNTPETPTEKMKVPNVFQVWNRLLDVQSRNLSQMGAAAADFTISPEVAQVDIGAFEDTPKIARLGVDAMNQCLADLKQQLHQIDEKLFPVGEWGSEGVKE